ncbi:hypothetical protein Vadar_032187 [Vaccinium darrowii]|uniref:Uncharacterized protein n=1 Tax=Vaccinium darrowii TaxID=229202 RepID=A0ACB7Z8X1_9ERIC|nr:hypothetical protein Vadar_032187 [Vaccinium darrowii]
MRRSENFWGNKVNIYGDRRVWGSRSIRPSDICGDPLTLFVDNLPNSAEVPWFKKLFSNYGRVVEAIIPNKRSRKSGNKFGFMRFNSSKSASEAIVQTSGLRVGRRNLFVKNAKFGRRSPSGGEMKGRDDFNRFAPLNNTHFAADKGNFSKDRCEGFPPIKDVEKRISINLQPIASEWLWRSAIAELKDVSTPEIISNAFSSMKFNEVKVRSMGGKFMIITFQNKDDRIRALSSNVIKGWFLSFKHWNGDAASLSRTVWLKIRGMPLNAWGCFSFKRIAQLWGEFLTLDQETLLEESFDVGRLLMVTNCSHKIDEWINIAVKGRNYRVQVWEEECNDPFDVKAINLKEQQMSNNNNLHSCPRMDRASQVNFASYDNHVSPAKNVEKDEGPSKEAEKNGNMLINETSGENLLEDNNLVEDIINKTANVETLIENNVLCGVGSRIPMKAANNLDSFEEEVKETTSNTAAAEEVQETPSKELLEKQMNIHVDTDSEVLKSTSLQLPKDLEFSKLPEFLIPKVVRTKKRKELRALCATIEEFERVSDINIQYQVSGNNPTSVSSGDIAKRNEAILKELSEAIQVNKSLNVKFHESDEVTLNRMLQLEVEEIKRRQQAAVCI